MKLFTLHPFGDSMKVYNYLREVPLMRKRTLCIILSAVMLLTLIPITVFAGTGADTITIENILPSGMLSGSIKFYNENGYAEAYVYNGILYFQEKNNHSSVINDLSITTPVTKNGNNYTATNTSESFIFTMNSDALESITVNSTIERLKGKYTEPHAHVVDGETVTFDAWTSDNSLPTNAGSYYLTSDITLSSTWGVPKGTQSEPAITNLCLNGHVIKLNSEALGGAVIYVGENAEFNLYDCNHDNKKHFFTYHSNAAWELNDNAEQSAKESAIPLDNININTITDGSLISIEGGCITGGNHTNYSGGGIEEYKGSLTINGGNIVGNTTAYDAGGINLNACVNTVSINNCNIVGNYTTKNGGGLYSYDTNVNMTGGLIGYNIAAQSGGGVFIKNKNNLNSYYTMSGGTISGNTASSEGGGVYIDASGSFTMNGGTIADCTAKINGGGVKNNGTLVMKGGTIQGCKALSSESKEGLGGAIYNYGEFTLSGGLIQNNTATRYGGGIHNCGPAKFTMTAGSIINNKAEKGGGGINSDGNLTISGGTILENEANTENGGGVRFNAAEKEFIMSGGTIKDNKSKGHGGGIYSNGASLTVSGTASITGNEAGTNGNNAFGGGIYIAANSFTMTGGTITDNHASDNAGGVHIFSTANNPTIGGTAQITGNTKGEKSLDSNLNVNKAKNVVIATGDNKPASTMSIGITQGAGDSERPGGQFTTNGTADDVQYFSSDDSNYYVRYNNDGGYLEMVKGYTVTFDKNGGDADANPTSINETYGAKYTLPTTNPTKTGYTFAGWFTATSGGTQVTTDSDVTITAAQTLYAQWTANTTNITLEKQSGTGGTDSVTATYDAAMPPITIPTREGYIFNGYFNEAFGGKQYYDASGASVENWDIVEPNAMLFAQWTQQYTVTYDGNGATSGEVVDSNKYVSGDTFTVLPGDSLVREGYTFKTWNRAADGGDDEYNPGEVQGITRNITLYAQWTKNPTPKPDPKPTPEPEPINYKITQGANSIWTIAAGENPTFRSNAPFEKFSHVLLDGKELAKKHYKYESGSTLITLTPEYTATLAVGKHTIEIVSTDGSAATVFYIEETIANTNGEGFALSTATMSSLFVACNIVGLSAVFFELKKKKKAN